MYLRCIYSSSSELINAIFNLSDRPHFPLSNKCKIIHSAYMYVKLFTILFQELYLILILVH
ncbi:hypothetical protein RhiirC2_534396 [Rhizophagus irregularis]|uniref:Uncharacterized protein n=1 Tax=Rhizophagus irregularis TaxID=588596 RepID=A0A2N1N3W0_9GLOM|nr:hypothetical protein RhiirC2_534396 [Rhizophagus irregularis]